MICSGAIWPLPGMLLAMKMTEPYSPTARANDSATPLSHAGNSSGKITRRKTCQPPGPEAHRGLLVLRVPFLQHRLHRAHDERQADERPAR